MSENTPTPPNAPDAVTGEVVEDTDPGLSHQITDEALEAGDDFTEPEAPEQAEKPEDAPSFPPLHALPRQQRAAFAEAAAKVDVTELSSLSDGDDSDNLRKWALAERVAADMEAAMDIVIYPIPASKAAWERWKEAHKSTEDDAVMRLFSWYMSTMKPGEAQPSPTS